MPLVWYKESYSSTSPSSSLILWSVGPVGLAILCVMALASCIVHKSHRLVPQPVAWKLEQGLLVISFLRSRVQRGCKTRVYHFSMAALGSLWCTQCACSSASSWGCTSRGPGSGWASSFWTYSWWKALSLLYLGSWGASVGSVVVGGDSLGASAGGFAPVAEDNSELLAHCMKAPWELLSVQLLMDWLLLLKCSNGWETTFLSFGAEATMPQNLVKSLIEKRRSPKVFKSLHEIF